MDMIRKLAVYLIAFGTLAGTLAVISASVYAGVPADDPVAVPVSAAIAPAHDSLDDGDPPTAADEGYKPRLTAPSLSNPYYYSDSNVFYLYGWGMPNCTCYAWGRAYEITGEKPDLSLGSAYLWYDYNLEYGVYPCGSEPRLGAIACWTYTSGAPGHVAVVEKIEDGEITFSNSAYSGTVFYTSTAPIDDPSDGRETWIFQGYIYVADFGEPAEKGAGSSADPNAGDPDADEP